MLPSRRVVDVLDELLECSAKDSGWVEPQDLGTALARQCLCWDASAIPAGGRPRLPSLDHVAMAQLLNRLSQEESRSRMRTGARVGTYDGFRITMEPLRNDLHRRLASGRPLSVSRGDFDDEEGYCQRRASRLSPRRHRQMNAARGGLPKSRRVKFLLMDLKNATALVTGGSSVSACYRTVYPQRRLWRSHHGTRSRKTVCGSQGYWRTRNRADVSKEEDGKRTYREFFQKLDHLEFS